MELNSNKKGSEPRTTLPPGKGPSVSAIERELRRIKNRQQRVSRARGIALALAAVSSLAIFVAVLFLPILQIYGNSMTPTLYEGNIVISVKGMGYETGDIVSVYYNNNILVKRVIAFAGDWVDIAQDGTVSVNGEELEEPYLVEKAFGDCDIELPYQVPDNCIFVVGDHRSSSKDSRNSSMGPIPREKVVGRIVYRVWPLTLMGEVR